MRGESQDGNDVRVVYEAVGRAVARARRAEGPTLLEFVTFRMTGHSAHDDAGYVPKTMFEEWERKDPIRLFEDDLKRRRLVDAGALREMETRIEGEQIGRASCRERV